MSFPSADLTQRVPSAFLALAFLAFGASLPFLSASVALLIVGLVLLGALYLVEGAKVFLGAFAFFAYSGWTPLELSLGPIDLTVIDVIYVFLVAEVWRSRDSKDQLRFSIWPLAIFLLVVGLSMVKIIADPDLLSQGLVSWVRLVQTASVAFIAARLLRSPRDVSLVLLFALAGALFTSLEAIRQFANEPLEYGAAFPRRRYGGFLNQNQFGLVAGSLILTGLFGGFFTSRTVRSALIVTGVIGMILSKSLTSGLALIVALAVGTLFRPGRSDRGLAAAKILIALVAVVGSLFVYTDQLRPEEVPGAETGAETSTEVRAMLARAGLELFLRNPIMGVGWQASSAPEVIGAPQVAAVVRKEFPDLPEPYYPDVTPTSVHNAYIQVAAETGVLGVAAFGLVISLGIRDVRRNIRFGSRDARQFQNLRALGLSLLALLIWWNTNPIFGGQTETQLGALWLGAFLGLSRTETDLSR